MARRLKKKSVKKTVKKIGQKKPGSSAAKKTRRPIRLGVNLDHVATLRQVRGGTTAYPDLESHVRIAARAGADQITIHLREDRRHIQDADLKRLAKTCPVMLNLEMGATDEMITIAIRERPSVVCLVPEKREELTTEGGLDVASHLIRFKSVVSKLRKENIPVSMFIEPSIEQVEASYDVGAVAVEFHTGKWVHLKGRARNDEWKRLESAATRGHELGLQIHAGHGLDYDSTLEIMKLPHLAEVNIGHFLVCEALTVGMKLAIEKMVGILRRPT